MVFTKSLFRQAAFQFTRVANQNIRLSTTLLREEAEEDGERDRGISVQSTQNQLSVTFSEAIIM